MIATIFHVYLFLNIPVAFLPKRCDYLSCHQGIRHKIPFPILSVSKQFSFQQLEKWSLKIWYFLILTRKQFFFFFFLTAAYLPQSHKPCTMFRFITLSQCFNFWKETSYVYIDYGLFLVSCSSTVMEFDFIHREKGCGDYLGSVMCRLQWRCCC